MKIPGDRALGHVRLRKDHKRPHMTPESPNSPFTKTMTFTTSSAFLKVLSNAGITHAFVNWGSDHPALLEDLQRQRIEGDGDMTEPKIVTCPNEMVALSAAQGYAQVTGKPAAVIVHVDVGTQVCVTYRL